MQDASQNQRERPLIVPLGDIALLVRFGSSLDDGANQAAQVLARGFSADPVDGVIEIVPSLVSVLLRYDPARIELVRLAGEISLRLSRPVAKAGAAHGIGVRFDGPDLADVAAGLGLTVAEFIAQHCAAPLRVLATGFAPGFVYCGFHAESLILPRRQQVRALVPAGSVLFAAGQTAIAATDIPTGWHVIGHTDFRNFDAAQIPPTQLAAGDLVQFESLA